MLTATPETSSSPPTPHYALWDTPETESLRYDPIAIAEYYSQRPAQVWGRFFAVIYPTLTFFLQLWWDFRTGQGQRNERKRAIQLRDLLTNLGPSYIKIGQALSTRPDLVPASYLEELTQLQDQLPPFPNEVAYQFIEEELGAYPTEIYAELSPKPIAAASLGQVYKGKLKTGETVAVKVQRPDLAQKIAIDIYILRGLSAWAQKNIKRIRSDLVGIIDEFASRIFEEMDYTQEGHNAERFAKLYGHMKDIYVPRIYWPYTRRRVLTMEWIDGVKLTQVEAIRSQGIDATHLVNVGVQCSLRQLLEHGFFHADPHPGNLLAMPDGKLAYLDFGMMSDVEPSQRYGLVEAIVHMVNRDFEGLAQDYIKLGFLTPDTDLSGIVPALGKVFNNALGASVAELNMKSITDDLSALMYEYPFRVPAFYALIIRSLVTLEGVAINVDPDFKVLSKAYPYVSKRLLTDPAPELRASLKDLLFKDGQFRWNRLENLLRNAPNSGDFELDQVVNQAVDFLFSERGAFIREQLIEEAIQSIDTLGRTFLRNLTYPLRERAGLAVNPNPPLPEDQQSLERFQRLWAIVQQTPGFSPMQLLPAALQVLAKPQTQQIGQEIVGGLAQRAIARWLREILASDEEPAAPIPRGASRQTYQSSL
jgi:predicted unusual protein kinase regulating ubiquinone biosynthesis (AarF/ABC1/UbiB family)